MSNLIPFQYSIKLGNGEIYMIQTATADELVLAKEELKSKLLNSRTIPEQPQVTNPQPTATFTPTPTAPKASVVCPVCGSKAYINEGVSAKGNAYKIFKCSKFPETQQKGGHSHFIK